jgi:iron complex outermembrane recepter protein
MFTNNLSSKYLLMAGVGMACGIAAPSSAQAQEQVAVSADAANVEAGLSEIIVTATKRNTTLQDTPLSVSVVEGDALADAGVVNLEGLGSSVPNFTVNASPIGDTIAIRGISTSSQAGTEQSVATFVDGIFRGRSVQSRFAFLDLGTLEVVRGPQGTLFGKNTVAGALNISSARPTNQVSALMAGTYEFNHNETELTGFVSGPVADWLRVRFAGQYNQLDKGWVYNVGYDETLPNSQSLAIRASAEADITDSLQLYVKYERGFFDIDGQPYEISHLYDGPLSALSATAQLITRALIQSGEDGRIDGRYNIRNTGFLDFGSAFLMKGNNSEAMARLDWSVGPGVLTGIIGRSKYDYTRQLDADNGLLTVLAVDEVEDYQQDSAELRYASDKIGPVSFLGGFYWQDSDIDAGGPTSGTRANFATLGVPVPAFVRNNLFTQNAKTYSGFGQISVDLTPTLTLTGGARYNREKKVARQAVDFTDVNGALVVGPLRNTYQALLQTIPHDIDLNLVEKDWTYSGNLSWKATQNLLVYGSVSTGVKGGGFNASYFGTTPRGAMETPEQFRARLVREATFRPEEAISYEIGAKVSPSRSVQLNIAAFYSKFTDLQTSVFTGGTAFIVGNAAEAESYGVEMDARWQISPEIEVFGNAAWLHFEFTDYFNAGCTVIQALSFNNNIAACSAAGGNDLTGRTNQNAPKWTSTIGFKYERDVGSGLKLRVGSDANFVSAYFAANDLDPFTRQDAYLKVNGTIGLASEDGWEVSLIGRNLTNELTFADSNDLPIAVGTYRVGVQRPRTVALRLKASF